MKLRYWVFLFLVFRSFFPFSFLLLSDLWHIQKTSNVSGNNIRTKRRIDAAARERETPFSSGSR